MSRAIGVALDIDGVLLRGKNVLPMASTAVNLLLKNRVPFIFLTNGGGVSELQKAKELTEKLDIPIDPRKVLLSHTPLRSLVPQYKDKPVLILGHDKCYDVARDYGFNKACNVPMIHAHSPDMFPRRKPDTTSTPVDPSTVAAIVNFHDPLDWAMELQIVSDILIENKEVAYYSCNADLTYAASYPRPRYTQGSFNESLKHLLTTAFNKPLTIQNFGKPFEIQYRFAENMLAWEAHALNLPPPQRLFGIGDNPKADIRGANNAGGGWKSVLVRTGIFSSSEPNDREDPAHIVADDVLDAIQAILKIIDKE